MRILCPLCGFGREIDEAKIPPRAQMATCPKCQHKFRFRVVDDPEQYEATPPAAPAAPSGVPGFGGAPEPGQAAQDAAKGVDQGPDPMAAQRARAAAEWQRLQGGKAPEPGQAPGTEPGQAAPKVVLEEPKPREPLFGPDEAGPQFPEAQPQAQPLSTGPEAFPGQQAPSTGSPVPFEDLPRHGFFGGLWGTFVQVAKTPVAFFRAMPVTGGMSKPLIFYLLVSEFAFFCHFAWGLVGIGAISHYLNRPEVLELGLDISTLAPLLFLIFAPLAFIITLLALTAVTHLLLRLVGAGGRGPEATFRVLCYASVPFVLSIVPLLGPQVAEVWSLVLTAIGLKEAHRTSLSKALFAVLVPIMMLVAAMLGLMQSGIMGA